jgi:carboxymethylenebutenolidase
MNLKIVFAVIVAIVAASAIIVFMFLQENESVQNNAGMLGNGRDVSRILTSSVEYTASAEGFLARPETPGRYPAIVMIHEFWGLNENIKDMAKQMASEGYVVLAADLYDGNVASESDVARQLATNVRNNPDKAIQNLKSALRFLRNHEAVDSEKVGSLGWCFGGGWSVQLALNQKMTATGIYYGTLVTDPKQLSVIQWPVLGIFGDADGSIPVEQVRAFEAALNENNVENEIYIYEGVGHAFANPTGANYAPEETKDAWEKTVAFFNKHLK